MKKRTQPQSLSSRIAGEHTPPAAIESPSAAETSIVPIDISLIEPYQHNPRLYDNPKFDTIKESIRERGVLQRLIVTKRPDTEKFTLCQGGNTRLKCLQELHQETSDPKFGTAYCELRPWRDETDLMVGHVVENELRGNLNWHEKSRMAVTLHQMFAALAADKLPDREFERLLQSKGVTIHHQLMHIHRYTVGTLEAVMPNQLRRGLARRPVTRIMKTDRALRSIWTSAAMSEQKFDEIFRATLTKFDAHETFNSSVFLSNVAYDISDLLGVPRSYLETAVDEYIQFGGDLPVIDGMPRAIPPSDPPPAAGGSGVEPHVDVTMPSFEVLPRERPAHSEISVHENKAPRRSHRRPSGETDALDGERIARRAAAKTETMRESIYRQANLFEIATGNRGCIVGMQLGYGFIVMHPPLESDRSQSEQIMRDQAWWLLHELSAVHEGLFAAPDLIKDFASSYRSQLTQWFETADPDDLVSLAETHGVRPRSLLHSIGDLIRAMDTRSLKVLMELMTAVQRLEQHYRQTETNPWKTFAEEADHRQS